MAASSTVEHAQRSVEVSWGSEATRAGEEDGVPEDEVPEVRGWVVRLEELGERHVKWRRECAGRR